ncbi:MAG TPA: Arc family DNA-binding protein [Candidatus Krumholzibacteria bacterium]|nr:Arc family DNA-binding protein [Candidatus Krumholzibacteria bacterium]
MAERKSFLIRLPAELLDELNRWAKDDLRSVNGQIEFLLRDALKRHRGKELRRDDEEPPAERPA